MKVSDVIRAVEAAAPLQLQDEWDNSGLQVGFPGAEVHRVLTCLDVTESIVAEARDKGCDMIVSHHPLIFHPLRQIAGATYQQRAVVQALSAGIAIYSAHTSLDNAPEGVNRRLATMLGLKDLEWLQPKSGTAGGSGVIGTLPAPMKAAAFLGILKNTFNVECLRHTAASNHLIEKVALCGGAGAILMRDAMAKGADAFVTGELHYHDYFESEGMLLAELGHYQSEECTITLLQGIISDALPSLDVIRTELNTNATRYDAF